jgi:hypothetical protein
VFGTIKVSDERHRILGALAHKCGLPDDGRWELDLEWVDADALLNEPTPHRSMPLHSRDAPFLLLAKVDWNAPASRSTPMQRRLRDANQSMNGVAARFAAQSQPVLDVFMLLTAIWLSRPREINR